MIRLVFYIPVCLLTVDAGGQNKQHLASKNTAKLDRETEELHHEHVTLDTAKLIQQARQAKGWTQKDLATVSSLVTGNNKILEKKFTNQKLRKSPYQKIRSSWICIRGMPRRNVHRMTNSGVPERSYLRLYCFLGA